MKRSAEEILNGLDELFSCQQMEAVELYLQEALQECMQAGEASLVITIVNELIGFYRDTSQYDKAIYYCEQILPFMAAQGLEGSIHYATTCLNVANAYRAAGEWEKSFDYYDVVKEIYDKVLSPADSLYASYYNNLSLLYQETEQFAKAAECLKKALVIIEPYGDEIKVAITCSNLAASLLRTGAMSEAEEYLNRSLRIFIADGEGDFHYGSALSVMGELQYRKGNLEEAKAYYARALAELEKHVGKTEYYYRTRDNLEEVEAAIARASEVGGMQKAKSFSDLSAEEFVTLSDDDRRSEDASALLKGLGLQLAEAFYHEYGKPMLEKKFPAFIDKIAVGLAGEGSECFGFDDEVSGDHDYGPGFCLWVSRDTYEEIGDFLQAEYEKLPTTYRGISRRTMAQGQGRVGVCVIEDFYERLIGLKRAPETLEEWSRLEEPMLAAAVNGRVFRDEEGSFSKIREELNKYYPDVIWRNRIAQEMYHLSQYGQYNYGRMLKRSDVVTASLCRSSFIDSAMKLVYLLNRTYAPYYKWMYRGMDALDSFGVKDKLEALTFVPVMNREDNEELIENICICFLKQMERMGLLKRNSQTTYLEHYIGQVVKSLPGKNTANINTPETSLNIEKKEKSLNSERGRNKGSMITDEAEDKGISDLADKLVSLEWKCFDKVQNEGGRADCQNDWNTFSIMRKSQYLTWTKELLESYIKDFETAIAKGWNLITEKYGRMMESTAPDRYAELKDEFPYLSEEKKAIVEAIVKIQVGWMEEFAADYPKMAGNSRVIHTAEDTLWSTSFETYLRGEMSTYSDRTLDLYGRFIVRYLKEERNLTKEIMTNTALLYGYESLDKAEELLREY